MTFTPAEPPKKTEWTLTPDTYHVDTVKKMVYVWMETMEDVYPPEKVEPGQSYTTPQRTPRVWGIWFPEETEPEEGTVVEAIGPYPEIVQYTQMVRKLNGVGEDYEIRYVTKAHLDQLKAV